MHKGGIKIWLTPRVQHREQTKSTHACEVHSTMLGFESQNTKKKKKNPAGKGDCLHPSFGHILGQLRPTIRQRLFLCLADTGF